MNNTINNNTDAEYFRLINLVLDKGRTKTNRTGVDTLGLFGAQSRFDLQEGLPLLTTKKVFFKGIVHELLWFLSGSTNIKYLVDNDVHIWDEWAYQRYLKNRSDCGTQFTQESFIAHIKNDSEFAGKWGELGEGTYGGMWRSFPYFYEKQVSSLNNDDKKYYPPMKGAVDQIQKVINKLKSNPDDRRMIVSAWHPYWVDYCALPPCHALFQFHTEELTHFERVKALKISHFDVPEIDFDDPKTLEIYKAPTRRLNCQLYQRSADLGLGVPFNWASYALLLSMVAQVTNMAPGEFVWTAGDLHIYKNHLPQIKEQLNRIPFSKLPRLILNPSVGDILDFKYCDIKLAGYESHPAIKMEVAV